MDNLATPNAIPTMHSLPSLNPAVEPSKVSKSGKG